MHSKRPFSGLIGLCAVLVCASDDGMGASGAAFVLDYPGGGANAWARSQPEDYVDFSSLNAFVLGHFNGSPIEADGGGAPLISNSLFTLAPIALALAGHGATATELTVSPHPSPYPASAELQTLRMTTCIV